MVDPKSEPIGEAQIESMFRISGRGWVLLFRAGDIHGKIFRDGIVQSDRGAAPYKGPDHARRINGPPTLGVLIADNAKPLFEVGRTIRFYKAAEPDKV
jgi:hypothetical protein